MPTRRAILALILAGLVPAGRAAAQKGGGKGGDLPGEILQPGIRLVVEYWDRDGLFHLINADLIIVLAKEGIKVGKPATERIHQTLASMPWEEVAKGNPAVTIKQVALDAVRTDEAAGRHVVDVLIAKLMIR